MLSSVADFIEAIEAAMPHVKNFKGEQQDLAIARLLQEAGLIASQEEFEAWRDAADAALPPLPPALPAGAPRPADEPPQLYSGDLLSEIANTTLHILLACLSGAGKSTTLKTLIYLILGTKPDAQFFIVDPKTTDWLGLQRFPGVVTYLSGDELDQLGELAAVVRQVFRILDDRVSADQKARRKGQPAGQYHDVYLVIDEWFSLYNPLSKTNEKKLSIVEADSVMSQLNTIIAKGRELKVHLVLVSQSHLAGETGISTAMRRSLATIAQGFISPTGDGGFASIEGVISDANVIKSPSSREQLMTTLAAGKEHSKRHRSPLLLTTMGEARIGLLPNLSEVHSVQIENYKYGMTAARPKNDFEGPLPPPDFKSSAANPLGSSSMGANVEGSPETQSAQGGSPNPQGSGSTANLAEWPENPSPDFLDKVRTFIDLRMTQDQIIYAVIGAKKGGGSTYQTARLRFRQIAEDYRRDTH